MKKKGVKFLVFIIILALLGGAIYLIVQKSGNKDKRSPERIVEDNSLKYFLSISEGYDSEYNGKDRLFAQEEFTKGDLNTGLMLTAAYNYVLDPTNNIENEITPQQFINIENDIDLTDAVVVKGKNVRDAIKVLFGVDFTNEGYKNTTFKYTYSYISSEDVYVRKEKTNSSNDNCYIAKRIISNKKSNGGFKTEIAIAYAIRSDDKFKIYSDPERKELVKETESLDLDSLNDKELKKLPKYNLITKNQEGNYIFEKIEAVK